MTADPLCTCGHACVSHYESTGSCCWCDCKQYAVAGSLEDILGVWRDQGQFPLSNTQDVKLLVDEIHRLRTRDARARALLSWINGRCVDEAPHKEIRAAVDRYNQEQQ